MSKYSISDLEKLTGIKAHTIRIWEQRFGLVVPSRTETNIRYYTEEDLRTLMNIALLNKQGTKISKIAKMDRAQISELVSDITSTTVTTSSQIDALILAMLHLKEIEAEQIFSRYMKEGGFENTMAELVYPFLDKLNILWLTGSIQQVHERFIGNLIKRKIILAIEQLQTQQQKDRALFLLYLREGETQELTVLYLHYLLRSKGFPVINLGTGVTLTDVSTACNLAHPTYVFSVFNEPMHRQSMQSYVDGLSKSLNGSQMLITGHQIFSQHLQLTPQFRVMNGLEDAMTLINGLEKNRL